MLILGIDTATPWGTIALYKNDAVIFELSLKAGKGGGEYLVSLLGDFMKKAGRAFEEIDLIATGTGPGSYTGIRVGLAAVKGLAEGLSRPVFGVNTLRIIAENARYAETNYIASVIDARRDQVYAALYQKTGADFKELEPPQVISVPQFATGLGNLAPDTVMICGDGSKVYQAKWKLHNIIIAPPDWDRPLAGKVAQIAYREWVPSRRFTLDELTPCYLRRVEAELRLEERLNAVNDEPDEG
jgi:tRNA threonylcarbamoyladenosine biosynthesis protein TsaB